MREGRVGVIIGLVIFSFLFHLSEHIDKFKIIQSYTHTKTRNSLVWAPPPPINIRPGSLVHITVVHLYKIYIELQNNE